MKIAKLINVCRNLIKLVGPCSNFGPCSLCFIEAICLMEFMVGAVMEATFLSGVLLGLLVGVVAGVYMERHQKKVKKSMKQKPAAEPTPECAPGATPGAGALPDIIVYVSDHGEKVHWRRGCRGLNAARRVRELKVCVCCRAAALPLNWYADTEGSDVHWRRGCPELNGARRVRELKPCDCCRPT